MYHLLMADPEEFWREYYLELPQGQVSGMAAQHQEWDSLLDDLALAKQNGEFHGRVPGDADRRYQMRVAATAGRRAERMNQWISQCGTAS